MPSTRKQKAKERRSRQLDMMSYVENVDIMIGNYSRNEDRNEQNESEVKLDLGSNRPQQSSNLIGEDFRSLLNTNSRENSEMTVETNRMISEEISNQTSIKLNEIKESLNYQLQDEISSAITDKVLPSIQNTLNKHGKVSYTVAVVDRGSRGPHEGPTVKNYTTVDHRSGGLQRNLESENSPKTREKRNKTLFSQEKDGKMSRQSSVDYYKRTKSRQHLLVHSEVKYIPSLYIVWNFFSNI